MNQRALALDALRGYAIITMVLSATIIFSILPGWMSHAQTPPPEHIFNPEIPGITWVDLVFPFFLFAMGAAFPFSIGRHAEKGRSKLMLCYDAIKRGIQLTFFAIFIQHFYPYVISSPQDLRSWLLAITCFMVLFPMFMRIPYQLPEKIHKIIKLSAYLIAIIMLVTTQYANERSFSLYFSNIIILILANMAIFGSLLYIFTIHNRLLRICILILLGALMISKDIESSWVEHYLNISPIPWLYRFEYLEYLFIVIPGSFAGEILKKWLSENHENIYPTKVRTGVALLSILVSVILVNLYCLYNRFLEANLIITIILLTTGYLLLKGKPKTDIRTLWYKLFDLGSFFLLLGLFIEPFQEGIKKDYATFSYFFVTSGLAFMTLIIFNIICDYFKCVRSTRFLIMSGQNPMIAYVATDLLIYPILNILGITPLLKYFYSSPWLGFLHGIILTSLTVFITMFFTRIKWYWRT